MIEIAGLRKAYGGRTILDGVDLVVRPGQLVALLGPNGAGKTTTVEIVEGYRAADAGTVRVLGEDAGRGGPALRARVGLMLQGGAGLEPRATPRDLLRLYAAFHDGGRRADELLELAGLASVATTRVRRLSGGERQRLALAIALAGDPEVLIRRGVGDEAAAVEDRDPIRQPLDVADAPPDELTTDRAGEVWVRLHAAPAPDAVARLRIATQVEGAEVRIRAERPTADLVLELAQWAAREGLLITELRAGASTLEERYFELTGDRDVEGADGPRAAEATA